jgi:CheY-like chemotaxis protein
MSAKKTILIVEGSRTQAERLRLVLQASGYSTTVVTDGREALATAHAQQPALIISGVALAGTAGAEGMDGYDMCAALKQDAKLRHIPVVLLTALSDIDDLIRSLKSRVDYCIAKPYQEEELLARVSTLMSGLVQTVAHAGQEKLAVYVRGEREFISSDRQQLARLLLSTYENYGAILRQNRSLSTTQLQLKTQNQHLLEECERLQTALRKALETVTSQRLSPADVVTEAKHANEANLVLIVEDTAVNQRLLMRLLEKLGRQADVVANGIDAIEIYKKRRHATIFMDIEMPVMDGFEATRRIRQHEHASREHALIIAMTAHTQLDDRERCVAAGMDEYLPKPVTLETLKRVLTPRLPRSSSLTVQDASAALSSSARVESV